MFGNSTFSVIARILSGTKFILIFISFFFYIDKDICVTINHLFQDDLKSYLRLASVEDKCILSTKYILWSTQLISALKHLHNFNFIHP